eukprot:gene15107-23302_t
MSEKKRRRVESAGGSSGASAHAVVDLTLDDSDDDDIKDVTPAGLAQAAPRAAGAGTGAAAAIAVPAQVRAEAHQSTFAAAPEPRRIPAKPKETKVSKNVKEGNEKSGLSNDAPAGPSAITCAVCLEPATNMMVTHCGHVFCNECICDTIKEFKKCPICRTKLTRSKIHPIYL